MKKVLVILLVMLTIVTSVIVMVPSVSANAASKSIMSAQEFADKCYEIATEYKTLYVMGGFGAPMSAKNKSRYINNYSYNKQPSRANKINAASSSTFAFDCVCLIKGVLWNWSGNASKTYGGANYASNGVSDMSISTMLSKCTEVSRDFSDIAVGEILFYKDNSGYSHVGVYIGDGLAVESTPIWDDGVQVTAVLNQGSKSGYHGRSWYSHGKLTAFLSYETNYDELKVTCEDFLPAENSSLPLGKSYPVSGVIKSNYSLKTVVGKIDGDVYFNFSFTNNSTKTLNIEPTGLNHSLKFAKLSAGQHTITIIATDTLGRSQTVVSCKLTIVAPCSHSYSYLSDSSSHWRCCSECGTTVDFEDHIYTNGCDVECDICGAIRSVNHTYSATYDRSDAGHWYSCMNCGEKSEISAHSFESWETVEATCIREGVSTSTCKCGFTIAKSLPVLSHNYGDWYFISAKDSSNTERCRACHLCGTIEVDTTYIDENNTNKTNHPGEVETVVPIGGTSVNKPISDETLIVFVIFSTILVVSISALLAKISEKSRKQKD